MKSSVLVEDQDHCIICGKDVIHRHHVFFGSSNRKNADEDGYWVPLCQPHHTGKHGVHFYSPLDLKLKRYAQEHFEQTQTREAFIRRYGKSYL